MKTQKTTTGIFLIIAWSIILLTIPLGNVGSQHHSGGVSDNRLHIEPLIRPADFNFRKEGELPPLPTVRLNVKGSDALINDITIGRGGGGFQENTALGYLTLYFNTDALVSKSYEGKYNTAVGAGAMHKNELGSYNTSVGAKALYSNVGGYYNTALGYATLYGNTSGACNTGLGFEALRTNSSGGFNTAVGVHALVLNNGSSNTAVGFNAMEANTTGNANTAVGYRTLELNIVGENNTAVGYKAGKQSESDVSVTEGTFVGADAYPISNDLFNVTGIGYGARPTESNMVWLGNASVEHYYCAGTPLSPSDEKYKSNVEEKVAGLDFILRLRPVTFNLDVHKMAADLGEDIRYDKDGTQYVEPPPERMWEAREKKSAIVYSGFVAQEVDAVAGKLEYDFSGIKRPASENGFYGLSYAKFVVPIVKAIQEQQAQIELLQPATVETMQQELEALKEEQIALLADNQRMQKQLSDILSMMDALGDAIVQCCNMEATNADHPDWHDGKPRMEQNAPNPFNEHTLIRYYLPPGTQQASILVTDINGVQRKVIELSRGGGGQTIIRGGTLTPGTYIYTLRVNGQQTDSKWMVLL